jgi:hypothetical protein
MKLEDIAKNNLTTGSTSVDIDVGNRIGPEIARCLDRLTVLAGLLPNSQNIMSVMEQLRSLFAKSLPDQASVLEKFSMAEGIIYDYNPKKSFDDQEALVIGGAGRYTMAGLRRKAAREANDVASRVTNEMPHQDADYKPAQYLLAQLANTIDTYQKAATELTNSSDVAMEQQLQSPVHPAVHKLETELRRMVKQGQKTGYDQIDAVMQKISRDMNVSTDDLHKMFCSSHGASTPDQWIRFVKDKSI